MGDSLAFNTSGGKDADTLFLLGSFWLNAKILNPSKKVLIPDMNAACSLADSCPADLFEEFLKNYPDYTVLSYVNCSAAVKTLSDIIVTSTNALKIVEQLPKDEKIIFAPDKNLGSYINNITGRNMILWDGVCHVHNQLNVENIINLKFKILMCH